MNNKVLFSSVSDHWKTPAMIYNQLDYEFHFDFDPCPFHAEFDGLNVEWGKSSFVNPPYSNISKWCEKAYNEFKLGKTVVLLIPSRTDTEYWHTYVMRATEIRFLKGRLNFNGSKNSAPFPSSLVIFKANE
jgi:phage N-6-adenine-methyltransferase